MSKDNPRTVAEYLGAASRVFVAVLVCELLGGAIGLLAAPHFFPFFNLWFGGMVAMVPGFVIGLVWQLRSGGRKPGWIEGTCFLGFLVVVITIFGYGFMLPSMRAEMRNLSVTADLRNEPIRRIEVFDEGREKGLADILNPESVAAFAEAIADLAGHAPSHPEYTHTWYVVVHGAVDHKYMLHLDPQYPREVVGDFLSVSGKLTDGTGSFRSRNLLPWVKQHLPMK